MMKRTFTILALFVGVHAFSQTTGSKWKLLYVYHLDGMVNISSKKSEMLISIPEQKLSGTIGCNSYSGTLDYTKGDAIKPIKAVNTKNNCPAKPDPLDAAVLKALDVANKLSIHQNRAKFYQGDKLVLELSR